MSSSSCTNDRQELEHVMRMVIMRLVHPPRSLRVILQEIDPADVMGPDLTMVIEHLTLADRFYCRMLCSTSRHSCRKAQRRRRMIRKAINRLHKEGKIFTSDGHIVHPNVRPLSRSSHGTHRPKKRKKFDQRPYHGRPGRDRGRPLQHIAA